MYKYITILGAAGQIAQKLTATLLTYTDMHITFIIWSSVENTYTSRDYRP